MTAHNRSNSTREGIRATINCTFPHDVVAAAACIVDSSSLVWLEVVFCPSRPAGEATPMDEEVGGWQEQIPPAGCIVSTAILVVDGEGFISSGSVVVGSG